MPQDIIYKTGIRPIKSQDDHFPPLAKKQGQELMSHVFKLTEYNSKISAQVTSAFSSSKNYELHFYVTFISNYCCNVSYLVIQIN